MASPKIKKKPTAERFCVRQGLASVGKSGGVRYNWPAVFEYWQAWPDHSLIKFAKHTDIDYPTISHRPEFAVADKKRQLQQVDRRWTRRAQSMLNVSRLDDVHDPAELRDTLGKLLQAAQAHASYINAKSVNITPTGEMVNTALTPAQVRHLAEALNVTVNNIKELALLSAAYLDEHDDTVKDEPEAVVGRIGA